LSTSGNLTASRASFVGFGLAALVGSLIFLIDYWNTRPDTTWPLVDGVVVERRPVQVLGFATRTQLTIRVQTEGQHVHAVLSVNASSDIPDVVRFRYSGDPSREVFLEEESSSLTVGLVLLALAIGLVVVWPFYQRELRRKNAASAL
jgi:hypothetical protein